MTVPDRTGVEIRNFKIAASQAVLLAVCLRSVKVHWSVMPGSDAVFGDLFDQIDNAAPQSCLLDAGKRPRESKTLLGCQKVRQIGGRGRRVGGAGSIDMGLQIRRTLEKERDRYLKFLGNLLDAAVGYTI
jgi:hypothetical protein